MTRKQFGGDKKYGESLFTKAENRFRARYVSKIPRCVETYHLTLLTIVWSVLIIVFSYFAANNVNWLWLVSLMIFFQYITDLFDGEVGRYRNTGLIKWGYYMDHFLDYIFLCSILIGYGFIVPNGFSFTMFAILALFGAFMVNSYLAFAATNEFKITYLKIGPTEVRLVFIILNTLIIVFGKTYMALALPYVLGFSLICLVVVVYRVQKKLWNNEMKK